MKFGMNSMSGTEKVDAETAMAISLGAKPEKRGYVNYKELQVTLKTEKERKEAHEQMNMKPKTKPKKTKKEIKANSSRSRNDGIVSAKKVLKNLKVKPNTKLKKIKK